MLSYDESEKEELDKKKEMEKQKKDEEHLERKKKELQIVKARKSALQQQIAEREQQEERGKQAERILRQEIAQAPTSTSSGYKERAFPNGSGDDARTIESSATCAEKT